MADFLWREFYWKWQNRRMEFLYRPEEMARRAQAWEDVCARAEPVIKTRLSAWSFGTWPKGRLRTRPSPKAPSSYARTP